MGSDDLARIIQEAHDLGLRVVVETVSLEDARQATVAGADALLRGVTRAGERVDGNLLSMMMEKGTVYIPTLAAVETGQDAWSESLETALANTRLVSQAGVPVAAGSGAGAWDYGYGRTWQAELSLLRAAGLTPAEVLEAATIGAARLLGVDDRLGTVEENKLADLLVLRGNPLLDVGAMDQVQIVIRNGVIVVDQLSPLSD